jgi:hypothetical protein
VVFTVGRPRGRSASIPAEQNAAQGRVVGGAHVHGGLTAQAVHRPLGDAASVGNDDDIVNGLLDLGEHVARDEDRLALRREVAQELAQPTDPFGVQAVGRLVEQQDLRVTQQGCGERETLAHAHRVATGALPSGGRDADEFEQLIDPLGRDAAGRGEHPQVVAAAPTRVEAARFERCPDGA